MKHRTDIDGLRAVAVIAVILFHAGLTQISGGFAGVDVFFVISGYLITELILNDVRNGHFSIARFYERRVRRILPALFTLLFFGSVAFYWLLPPEQLLDFGKSLIATVLFSSNVLFWRQTGYFKDPAEMKPLVHTWSLAVEEQFYIFYPLFLLIISRYFRKRYRWALLTVFCLSIALSAWGVHHNRNATFYLAPPRAWELLLGGLLAVDVVPPLRDRRVANVLGAAGLVLMMVSFVALSKASLFPGLNALYPTIGAALIIHSGSQTATSVSRFLGWKPIAFVGLISYSLYLWHWVLIVFAKYYAVRHLTNWEITGIVTVSFVIATLSWLFVENPFRGRRGLIASRRMLFGAAAVASLPLVIIGYVSYSTKGLPARFSRQALDLLAAKKDYWQRRPECAGRICRIGSDRATPSFLLWGDSHAGAIAPAMEHLAITNKTAGFVAFNPSCAPVLGLVHYNDDYPRFCTFFTASVLSFIKAQHITTVFLHARWAVSTEGLHFKHAIGERILLAASRDPADNYEVLVQSLRSTVAELQAIGVHVAIIASVPEVELDVPTMLARSVMKKKGIDFAPRYSEFMERQSRTFGILSRIAGDYGVQVIYPHTTLCDQASCLLLVDNRPLYIDDNHLSVHGAMRLEPALAPLLKHGPSSPLILRSRNN